MTSFVNGLSVVCVFNDPEVRRECLDRSLSEEGGGVDVDYIPVDNTEHAFSSAGAALNHGVRLARHPVVVLVHQDVYLHSVRRLVEVSGAFDDVSWGLLGANGITAEGLSVGRLRDRVQLIGATAETPVDVDSVDEVLVMAPRRLLLEHPLTEDSELAWHAYAVEYGLRLRSLGLRVGAVDCAITHNSLTVNLAKLDVAHRRVAELHPERGLVRTTCGTVGATKPRWRTWPVVATHGWRLRWLRLSLRGRRLRRGLDVGVVLSDIRHDVDLLSFSAAAPLHLINVDGSDGGFSSLAGDVTSFTRYEKPVLMQAVDSAEEAVAVLEEVDATSSVLLVGVRQADLERVVGRRQASGPWVLGLQPNGAWLLSGPVVGQLPESWTGPQSVPLGRRRSGIGAGLWPEPR